VAPCSSADSEAMGGRPMSIGELDNRPKGEILSRFRPTGANTAPHAPSQRSVRLSSWVSTLNLLHKSDGRSDVEEPSILTVVC